jgi:hypothetical protein
LVAGHAVFAADFWWRHVELQATLWMAWLVSTPVVAAVAGRAIWRWLCADPGGFWPPWWCKPAVILAPFCVAASVAVAFAEETLLALEVLSGDHPPMTAERSGSRLYLRGDINLGSAAQVESALRSAPDIEEVVLDSAGGFVIEARRIARMIEARRLDTRIDRECHSACVDLFAAGVTRTMRAGAIVGLHSAWSMQVTPEAIKAIAFTNADFRRRLHAIGVERRFLEVGTSTPGHSMWINTARQAHVAGLATRVVE